MIEVSTDNLRHFPTPGDEHRHMVCLESSPSRPTSNYRNRSLRIRCRIPYAPAGNGSCDTLCSRKVGSRKPRLDYQMATANTKRRNATGNRWE